MKAFLGCILISGFSLALILKKTANFQKNQIEFIAKYFLEKKVNSVTSTLCPDIESEVRLNKIFSDNGIAYNWLNLENVNKLEVINRFATKYSRLGAVVDLRCPGSMQFLEMASINNLFIFERTPTFWLILIEKHASKSLLQKSVEEYRTEFTDPVKFLLEPYEQKDYEKFLLKINEKQNREFIENYKNLPDERADNNVKIKQRKKLTNRTQVSDLLKFKMLMDNEITLAVPGPHGSNTLYDLYGIYKATRESKPKILDEGYFHLNDKNQYSLKINNSKKNRTFDGVLLKSGVMIYQPEIFTSLDDLKTRDIDHWPKIYNEHLQILAQVLNFRIITRFYNDYGWSENGTFTHLMGAFQKNKLVLSGTLGMMRRDRLCITDYAICPYHLQIGVVFREPSLPTVTNIFFLPFSKGVWIFVCMLIILVLVALKFRARIMQNWQLTDGNAASFSEIFLYIFGAICQQGYSRASRSTSDRVIIFFLLLTSLFLFSTYSACILSLLQSSSSAILSIVDITKSNMEVGVQKHFPFFSVLMKEATHEDTKEYYRKKIFNKRGQVYFNRSEGIKKVRTGMFAFEVELNGGYKLMSQTYEEREKCGIKEIDLIPKPHMCGAIDKLSSYKEIFRQRLVRQEEIGLFDRTWKRWVDLKPKCEVQRIGFVSVGLEEFRHVLLIFIYGVIASLVLFCFERLLKKKKKNLEKLLTRKITNF